MGNLIEEAEGFDQDDDTDDAPEDDERDEYYLERVFDPSRTCDLDEALDVGPFGRLIE